MTSFMSDEQIISHIERDLLTQLRPVDPDPEFAWRLRQRLSTPPRVTLEKPYNLMFGLVAVSFGLFFGALLLWLLRRPVT